VFLTGLYLVLDGDEIRLVATDGGRLALRTAKLSKPATQKVGVIVPAKTMTELVRALAGGEGLVEIALAENQVVFTFPGARLVSRLIPGPFPNYQQVIPQGHKQRLTIGTEKILAAVKRFAARTRKRRAATSDSGHHEPCVEHTRIQQLRRDHSLSPKERRSKRRSTPISA
jgi:DNA polymerase-3 subunit beta